MKNTSVLSCEHIRVLRQPGRTDALLGALQSYLTALFRLAGEFGAAEITITPDNRAYRFEWTGDLRPEPADEAIAAIADADLIDVRVDLCSDEINPETLHSELSRLLATGELRDCAYYVALIQDDQTTSLVVCGMYHGAFLHGSVPFSSENQDILVGTVWSSMTHRAEFKIKPGCAEQAEEVADALEQRFEIDLARDMDDGLTVRISGIVLNGQRGVMFYRDCLARLSALSDQAMITGALTPEDDHTFALLRFVPAGSEILVQTAVAEH